MMTTSLSHATTMLANKTNGIFTNILQKTTSTDPQKNPGDLFIDKENLNTNKNSIATLTAMQNFILTIVSDANKNFVKNLTDTKTV